VASSSIFWIESGLLLKFLMYRALKVTTDATNPCSTLEF